MDQLSRPRTSVVAATVLWLVVFLLGGLDSAGAQPARVVSDGTRALKWREFGTVGWPLQKDDMVEVIGQDVGWYWAILPRDVFGARRGGWIPQDRVELIAPDTSSLAPAGFIGRTALVVDGPAPVRRWLDHGTASWMVADGEVVELILEEGAWYWVTLPRDAHGTRRGGWIRAEHLTLQEPPEGPR